VSGVELPKIYRRVRVLNGCEQCIGEEELSVCGTDLVKVKKIFDSLWGVKK